MGRTFFIGDTHFGDSAIIRYENRPFNSVAEMNEVLILNWNNTVSPVDSVFVVGDFFSSFCDIPSIITRLNGSITLVVGNHDIGLESVFLDLGVSVINYPIILDNFWIVSHEPMYVSANMPYANIFGHIHNNPIYKTVSIRSYCVCVERNNFKPISFDDIKKSVLTANNIDYS